MSFVAKRLNLRCFIDGIEVPVIGARTTYTEGAPAAAQVQLIGTDAVYDILPRSLVHLFVYDDNDFEPSNAPDSVRSRRLGPKDLRRYKFLYEGEVSGVQFTKEAGQRHAVITCLDHTSYWDFIKQHYVNFSNGAIETFENAFMGVNLRNVKFYDVPTKDVHSNIYTWLTAEGNLFDGVHRLIREMFFAANDFYASAFNRHRMHDKIVGLPNDTTAAKLFKLDFFQKFIQNQISSSGDVVSMGQMIQMLLGLVFHTYITIPFPRFDPKGLARASVIGGGTELSKRIIQRGTLAGSTLNMTIIKPDTTFLVPPLCNVLFPHQYNSVAYQRNYFEEPTRLFMRTSLLFTGTDKWLTERFYAPDFEVFRELFRKSGSFSKRSASVILPHERFVGLNPVQAWQNDLGAFVQKGARREYLGKLADFLFWKMRFSPRALNVSMPFNMNLIPGYPALVMESTAANLQSTRHWIGNITTLVHTVDQSGGWTHITMTGARLHNEVIDFDGNGRTLEDITSRGTDGFLDDRYDAERIGEQVYQPLFGIGSLLDLNTLNVAERGGMVDTNALDASTQELLEQLQTETNLIVRAVAQLQYLYRTVSRSSPSSLDSFVNSFTQRPKANLVDVLGVPNPAAPGLSEDESSTLQRLIEELNAQNLDTEGFMSVAVDPAATDHIFDERQGTTTRVVYVNEEVRLTPDTRRLVYEDQDGDGISNDAVYVTVPGEKTTVRKAVTVTEASPGKTVTLFNLVGVLRERQAAVQAYIDSLKDRGIRG